MRRKCSDKAKRELIGRSNSRYRKERGGMKRERGKKDGSG